MKRHIVLVGLPASGKSTVGPMLARELGIGFVDLDDRIAEAVGLSVPELWEQRGEAEFRRLELEHMDIALQGPRSVIAPGGGWAAIPGAMGRARELAFIIYVKVGVQTAAYRIADQVAASDDVSWRRRGGLSPKANEVRRRRAAERRFGASGRPTDRPVLGQDPEKTLKELLKKREAFYLTADAVVVNEGTAADAVGQIRRVMLL